MIDPREDNMLLVTTDGRKAALDLRLYILPSPTTRTARSTWRWSRSSGSGVKHRSSASPNWFL